MSLPSTQADPARRLNPIKETLDIATRGSALGWNSPMQTEAHEPLWKTKGGIVLIGFMAVAGFYLLTQHTAHVFGVLPFLLILACPLMHLFMHHGHRHHHGNSMGVARPDQVQGGPR